jgi:hypothetical protein
MIAAASFSALVGGGLWLACLAGLVLFVVAVFVGVDRWL